MKSGNLFDRRLRQVAAQSCVRRLLLNIWCSCEWSIDRTNVIIWLKKLREVLLLLIAPLSFSKVGKVISIWVIQVVDRTISRWWGEFLFHFIIINFNQTQNFVHRLLTSHHCQTLFQWANTALPLTFKTQCRRLKSFLHQITCRESSNSDHFCLVLPPVRLFVRHTLA